MDRTEASDAPDAGSIPVGRIIKSFKKRERIVLKRKKENAAARWIHDVATLIITNKKITLIVLAFLVIAVGAVIVVSVVSKDKQPDEDVVQIETEELPEEYVITDEPLQVDAIPEINTLMRDYYDAAAAGNVDVIVNLKSGVDDKDKVVLQKKSEYVEAYPTVTCYTKSGPVAGTYIVFAYYEVKLFDYEQTVPGLNVWYVCKKTDGSYYINDDGTDEKLANYCKAISVQDDYVDLTNTVNVKFNEAVANDKKLADFLDKLPEILATSVGEELAKANEPEVTEEEKNDEPEITDTTVKKAKTTDVLNVRASDSETADKVGQVQKGEVLEVIEQKINGWSKVKFDGKEAFIKSEFLEIVDGSETSSTNSEEQTISDEEAIANSPESGKAKARDTVNIRKSPSTEAEKITVLYKGEEVTVVQKQADGWTKIKFSGKTGYVKSEFLEK